jgi:hypothetical protein
MRSSSPHSCYIIRPSHPPRLDTRQITNHKSGANERLAGSQDAICNRCTVMACVCNATCTPLAMPSLIPPAVGIPPALHLSIHFTYHFTHRHAGCMERTGDTMQSGRDDLGIDLDTEHRYCTNECVIITGRLKHATKYQPGKEHHERKVASHIRQ